MLETKLTAKNNNTSLLVLCSMSKLSLQGTSDLTVICKPFSDCVIVTHCCVNIMGANVPCH